MIRTAGAGLLAAFALFATAADPAAPADKQVHTSGPAKTATAAGVKFRTALGLPVASLNTLGSRIDAARRAGDPVALANAANELQVAEKVSGKAAGLTSKQVLADAAKLASLRRQTAELKSVLAISDQVALADQQVAELKKLIDMNKAIDNKIAAQEEPNAPRKVVVNNYSPQYIDIQINGYLRGQVLPGSSRTFTVDQLWNPIEVKGWGDEDETIFGPIILQGRFGTYTWNINGDAGVPNPNIP